MVITGNPSKEPYFEKLSEIVAMTHKIGVLYNEAVKALNTYHSVATAQRMLGKLETYSQSLVRLQQQAVLLTKSLESRHEQILINLIPSIRSVLRKPNPSLVSWMILESVSGR